jgi:hypothetical protein
VPLLCQQCNCKTQHDRVLHLIHRALLDSIRRRSCVLLGPLRGAVDDVWRCASCMRPLRTDSAPTSNLFKARTPLTSRKQPERTPHNGAINAPFHCIRTLVPSTAHNVPSVFAVHATSFTAMRPPPPPQTPKQNTSHASHSLPTHAHTQGTLSHTHSSHASLMEHDTSLPVHPNKTPRTCPTIATDSFTKHLTRLKLLPAQRTHTGTISVTHTLDHTHH